MKQIYLFLCSSDTYTSRAIRFTTAEPYTHIAIAFDPSLTTMYSFARKQPGFPLPAGFARENLYGGFLNNRPQMSCALYQLEVTDEVYYNAQAAIFTMAAQADEYRYNLLGLLFCQLRIPVKRQRHYFCSQFVSEILTQSHAISLPKNSALMHPADFLALPELTMLFAGTVAELQLFAAEKEPVLPNATLNHVKLVG